MEFSPLIKVSAIIAMAGILFVFEVFTADVVSMLVMAACIATGLVTVHEGLSGLSEKATVTVASFFVITHAIYKTGALSVVTRQLSRIAANSPRRLLAALMVMASASSSMLHATGVVAVYMPVVIDAARGLKESASRFLIPLSYAAQFGGVCTLVGTTSNLVVSGMMEQQGMKPVGMFEITWLGLPLFCVGFVYMMTVGWFLIPPRRPVAPLADEYKLEDYLTELRVRAASPLAGKTLAEADLRRETGIHVFEIIREGERLWAPGARDRLQAGDILVAKVALDRMLARIDKVGLDLCSDQELPERHLDQPHTRLVEAQIRPGSAAVGQTLIDLDFRRRHRLSVLALKRNEEHQVTNLRHVRLKTNDILLLQGSRDAVRMLGSDNDYVVLSGVATPTVRRRRLPLVLGVLGLVVLLTAMHAVDIVVSSLFGALLLVVTRTVSAQEAYENINWRVIFLIVGMFPLGIAIQKSGLAGIMAENATRLCQGNPYLLLCACYFTTMIVTEFVTHVACAILMTPIAIAMALHAGLDPRPFCIAVVFAADTSFSTPVGYQTNAMIFGPGNYRFIDFPRVGIPLNLLFWVLSSILIPLLWPLAPTR